MKNFLILVILTVYTLANPIIKVEGQELLKALSYSEGSPYVKLYNWDMGSGGVSPIIWDPNGNNWTPEGFERKGKVYLTNDGNITHTIVDDEKKPGYWNLYMLGNKDKIIKATLKPNAVTMENPSIKIEKAYIKKEIICKEDNSIKDTVYYIKFPKKVSFWLEEKTTKSNQGNKSEYIITYDKKPNCLKDANETTIKKSLHISQETKEQIKLFLQSFYKASEDKFPAKALSFYASEIDRYFEKRSLTKEDILDDKVRYYKKWPKREYNIKDIEIIDTYVKNTIRFYKVITPPTNNLKLKQHNSH